MFNFNDLCRRRPLFHWKHLDAQSRIYNPLYWRRARRRERCPRTAPCTCGGGGCEISLFPFPCEIISCVGNRSARLHCAVCLKVLCLVQSDLDQHQLLPVLEPEVHVNVCGSIESERTTKRQTLGKLAVTRQGVRFFRGLLADLENPPCRRTPPR